MLNNHFPSLKTLSLAQNQLTSLTPPDTTPRLFLPTVSRLNLEKNALRDLSSLASMSNAFPELMDLSLQQNAIEQIGDLNLVETSKMKMFSTLRSLNLSRNRFKDFHFVDLLSLLFPNLASLRISNNPLYTDASAASSGLFTALSDVPYSFTLARIPSLTILNYTTITARDREEGEIYYLSAAGKEITALLEPYTATEYGQDLATKIELAKAKHPRYEFLCSKYDRESSFEKYNAHFANVQPTKQTHKFAAGSIAARLVKARFYVPAHTEKVLHRSIARTIDVYRVKALVSRELGLQPLQFRLVHESEELDPVRSGIEQNSSDWESWGDWDVDGDDESSKEIEAVAEQAHSWTKGVLSKDDKKWKRRETEIVDGTRAWGEYIGDDEVRTVNIRVELYNIL